MLKVKKAAARNHIAVEINSKYRIPSLPFLRLAKREGCRFSLGSNRHDDEPGDLAYSIRMAKEVGLTSGDIFVPEDKAICSLRARGSMDDRHRLKLPGIPTLIRFSGLD